MMTIASILLLIFISTFTVTRAAVQCYSCNPCATTWTPGSASVIQTSNPNDFCRKTVSGTLVVKDSSPTCTPINIANNGVYCCQADFCNTANYHSLTMMNLLFSMILIWILNIY